MVKTLPSTYYILFNESSITSYSTSNGYNYNYNIVYIREIYMCNGYGMSVKSPKK